MNFDDLDAKMRVYETSLDLCVLPNMFIIMRLDGRGFTKLTKKIHKFEVPFDIKFRDYMVETTKYLMECGFKVTYAYTESDEISLLLHIDEDGFNRKIRKLNSIFAGEASAKFSLLLSDIGCFDSRVCQFPNKELVVDYFRWRNQDAFRNSLNSYCYYTLRKNGESVNAATKFLLGMSVADKNELLFQNGINFNDIPNWQKRGVGLYFEEYEKKGFDKKLEIETTCMRKRIKIDYDLPMGDEYGNFILNLIK
ncbi:MAG: guanylyltransferase [Oscillospiraceae bacterium]|nr:guanylyltransferase [Oscillospiraceae bacterium]